MPFRSPAALDLYDYAEKILNKKISINKTGVLSKVLDANSSEKVMEPHEFKNFFCLLIAAGNDTTRYSIAMALYQLSLNNNLIRDLRSNQYWGTCSDEFIRLASPTMYFRRTATCDVSLRDKNIKKGDKVITSGGIVGTVERVMENEMLEVRISDDVTVEIVKTTGIQALFNKPELKK